MSWSRGTIPGLPEFLTEAVSRRQALRWVPSLSPASLPLEDFLEEEARGQQGCETPEQKDLAPKLPEACGSQRGTVRGVWTLSWGKRAWVNVSE